MIKYLTELGKKEEKIMNDLFNYYFTKFKNCKPNRPRMEESQEGENFIIFYLGYYSNNDIYAGDIAKKLKCSTARVAVLLNRLEKKKFIKKQTSLIDKRKTKVVLTTLGKEEYNNRTKKFEEYLSRIIDTIGKEELDRFLDTLNIINRIGDEVLC